MYSSIYWTWNWSVQTSNFCRVECYCSWGPAAKKTTKTTFLRHQLFCLESGDSIDWVLHWMLLLVSLKNSSTSKAITFDAANLLDVWTRPERRYHYPLTVDTVTVTSWLYILCDSQTFLLLNLGFRFQGVAQSKSICTSTYGRVVAGDSGLVSAIFVVHEIGHA